MSPKLKPWGHRGSFLRVIGFQTLEFSFLSIRFFPKLVYNSPVYNFWLHIETSSSGREKSSCSKKRKEVGKRSLVIIYLFTDLLPPSLQKRFLPLLNLFPPLPPLFPYSLVFFFNLLLLLSFSSFFRLHPFSSSRYWK